ncbi:unnamed protein product, partial [Prorocentrum cordatum]
MSDGEEEKSKDRARWRGELSELVNCFQGSADTRGKSFVRYPVEEKIEKAKVVEDKRTQPAIVVLVKGALKLDERLNFKRTDVENASEKLFDTNREKWPLKPEAKDKCTNDMDHRIRSIFFVVSKAMNNDKHPKWLKKVVGDSLDDGADDDHQSVSGASGTRSATSIQRAHGWHNELFRGMRHKASDASSMDPELAVPTSRPPGGADPTDDYEATWQDGTRHKISGITNQMVAERLDSRKSARSGAVVLWRGTHVERNHDLVLQQKIDRKLLLALLEQKKKQILQVAVDNVGPAPPLNSDGKPQAITGMNDPTLKKAIEFMAPFCEKHAKGSITPKELDAEKKSSSRRHPSPMHISDHSGSHLEAPTEKPFNDAGDAEQRRSVAATLPDPNAETAPATEEEGEVMLNLFKGKLESMIGAIEHSDSGRLARALGIEIGELNEKNLKDHEHAINTLSNTLGQQGDAAFRASTTVPRRGQQRLQMIDEALANGKVEPRSSLGNYFRAELNKNPQEAKKHAPLKQPEADEHRKEWAERETGKLLGKYSHTRTWARVDTTQGDYLNLGQLVIDQGGWDDPEAIVGVLKLVNQCVSMGDPRVATHPQTQRVVYLRLKFKCVETFTKAWTSFQEEVNPLAATSGEGAGKKAASGAAAAAGAPNKGNSDGKQEKQPDKGGSAGIATPMEKKRKGGKTSTKKLPKDPK